MILPYPTEIVDVSVILMVPVLIARLVIGWTHPERTSVVWTFGIPTAGLLVYFVRVSITRNLDVFSLSDPVTAASYVGVLVSQVIAIVYQWMPETLVAWLENRR